MNQHASKNNGFSLIELVVAIVILSIGTTAFITLVLSTTENSIDPQIRVQGNAIARAYLEEIMLKSFCDPDWDKNTDADADPSTDPQNCPVDCNVSACTGCSVIGVGWAVEARENYDDVCDYNGLNDVGARDQTDAGVIAGLEDYTVDVNVLDTIAINLNGLNGGDGEVVRIDITVTHVPTGQTMALSSYKANY